ncbi:hypothetical protein [Methanoregula sp.]|uniref:hypothetical protein n=1 Tax=Methanoregula sp. TaxID=2052170 RepID=UPI003C7602B1
MKSDENPAETFLSGTLQCLDHVQTQEYARASSVAKTNKKLCKIISQSDENADSQIKKTALFFGISFNAFEELSELLTIVSCRDWIFSLRDVEWVWFLLQNCNERFESVLSASIFPDNASKFIKKSIRDIEYQIGKKYGNGFYLSPEVIIENSVCSICSQEPRSCSHIQNHVYDGKICRIIPTKINPGSCIIVTSNPKDKRCRIWNIRENSKDYDYKYTAKSVPFLVSFRIDDFLDSDSNSCLCCDFSFNDKLEELQKIKGLSVIMNTHIKKFEHRPALNIPRLFNNKTQIV